MLSHRDLVDIGQGARLWLWVAIGAGGMTAAVAVGQAYLLSQAIGQVFLRGAGLDRIAPLLVGLVGLALLRAGFVWAGELSGQRLSSYVKIELRERLLAHIIALGPAYTGGERSGELANTALGGVEALDEYLSQYLPQQAVAALAPLIILLAVLPTEPLSGLILLLTAPLIPLFMWLIGGLAKEQTARQWQQLSRMSAHFLDTLQGLPTLKMFGRSREQLANVARISTSFGALTIEVLRIAFLSALALELIASLSTAVLAVEIGLRLLYGRMAFEPALMVLILAPELYMPLRLLGQRHHAGMAGKEAMGRIAEILALTPLSPPIIKLPSVLPFFSSETGKKRQCVGSQEQRSRASLLLGSIIFDNVHYAYDQGARPALRGLSLEIPAGQTLALIGMSGAGKSTAAGLLLGFMQPDAGIIMVGGRPLSSCEPAAWRAQVAWVSQHPALFYGSVADNLRMARPDASDEELAAAARAAGAHTFIEALPQGYATPIGEGGAQLSGGQRQRLAIARAILKDAPFVILDEITSQLDPESEVAIRESLRHLLRGRTALLITHSPAMAEIAEQVVVIESGKRVS